MRLLIKAKNFDCGDALRTHITDQLTALVGKYFENADESTVYVAHEANQFRVAIQIHIGKHMLLQAHEEATDAYVAFEGAAAHIAKRLRRLKRRVRDHQRASSRDHRVADVPEAANGQQDEHGDFVRHGIVDTEKDNGFTAVVAATTDGIETLPIAIAVSRFDSSEDAAMVFRRRSDNRINVLYRRSDGAIGWVDPRTLSQAS